MERHWLKWWETPETQETVKKLKGLLYSTRKVLEDNELIDPAKLGYTRGVIRGAKRILVEMMVPVATEVRQNNPEAAKVFDNEINKLRGYSE